MCHPDSARRRRGGRLALDGGLVLPAVLVHRCYLRDDGKGWLEEKAGCREPASLVPFSCASSGHWAVGGRNKGGSETSGLIHHPTS